QAAVHAREPDGVEPGPAQRRHEHAVDRAGEHHLYRLRHLGGGDAAAVALLDRERGPPRQCGHGLATAVHQHHGADRAERIGARGQPRGAIELVAAELDDADAQHANPAVSASPSITFMFWMACPAAPLTRLSIAAISVRRGRRTWATGATPIATRLRYRTSLRDGSVPRVTATRRSVPVAQAAAARAGPPSDSTRDSPPVRRRPRGAASPRSARRRLLARGGNRPTGPRRACRPPAPRGRTAPTRRAGARKARPRRSGAARHPHAAGGGPGRARRLRTPPWQRPRRPRGGG